jgi:hypothetical protein
MSYPHMAVPASGSTMIPYLCVIPWSVDHRHRARTREKASFDCISLLSSSSRSTLRHPFRFGPPHSEQGLEIPVARDGRMTNARSSHFVCCRSSAPRPSANHRLPASGQVQDSGTPSSQKLSGSDRNELTFVQPRHHRHQQPLRLNSVRRVDE